MSASAATIRSEAPDQLSLAKIIALSGVAQRSRQARQMA